MTAVLKILLVENGDDYEEKFALIVKYICIRVVFIIAGARHNINRPL